MTPTVLQAPLESDPKEEGKMHKNCLLLLLHKFTAALCESPRR